MTTITLELPDTLAQQLRQGRVDDKEIQTVAVAAEFWLANSEQLAALAARSGGRFTESGTLFARHLIQQNRALFESLARR
jgi:hypothetical protein